MMAADLPRNRLVESVKSLFAESRPFRFIIVGGFNTGLCYAVYATLVWAGMVFWAANLSALLFGICLSFFTQGRIVFRNRDPSRFWRFVATWVAIYVVQTFVIKLLMLTGIGAQVGGLIVLPATAIVSYLVQKRVVFHRPGADA